MGGTMCQVVTFNGIIIQENGYIRLSNGQMIGQLLESKGIPTFDELVQLKQLSLFGGEDSGK